MTMTQVRNMSDLGVAAKTITTGVVVPVTANGFVPLTATTFFFPLGDADSTTQSVHVWCDSAIAGTFTLEMSDMPLKVGFGNDVVDVTDFVPTTGTNIGAWLPWSSTRDEVLVQVGSTNTNGSVVVVAGASTGFMWMLPDMGAKRMRVRAVITTPGSCRVTHHGKY